MNKRFPRWSLLAGFVVAGLCMRSPAHAADVCTSVREAMAQAETRLPFELVDGRIYVEATVNRRGPYRFAVDTGASGMGRADARLAAALGLRASGQVANSDGVRTTQSDTVRLEALALG